MNNPKFLKIVILLLLLINISTLTFMWLHRPQKNDAVGDFFTKELQFTPKQKEQFEVLKHEHRNQVDKLREENKEKHDAYFELLKKPAVDSVTVKKAAAAILKIEEQKELALFYHFQKVRAICNASQQQKFDKIINEAAIMMAPKPRRGEGRPKFDERPDRGEEGSPPPNM
jgi:Spy/CpxP family protein refolding chaperone